MKKILASDSQRNNRTSSKLLKLRARDGDLCCYCSIQMDFVIRQAKNSATIEHLTPIVLGGDNKLSNLKLACLRCNNARAQEFHDRVNTRVEQNKERDQELIVLLRERIISAAFNTLSKDFDHEMIKQLMHKHSWFHNIASNFPHEMIRTIYELELRKEISENE